MKDTIKKDKERKIIKEEYLDDNTLLEVSIDEGMVIISVRFVESPITGIREHTLLQVKAEDYMKHMDKLIDVNEKKDAIAIFTPTKEGYLLRDVYDAKEHEFTNTDFTDLLYRERFPQKKLNKRTIVNQ